MNIKQLTEELEKFLEEENKIIGEFELIAHGENATKYYDKATEYFKNHGNMVKKRVCKPSFSRTWNIR